MRVASSHSAWPLVVFATACGSGVDPSQEVEAIAARALESRASGQGSAGCHERGEARCDDSDRGRSCCRRRHPHRNPGRDDCDGHACPDLLPLAGAVGVPTLIVAEAAPGRGVSLFNTTDVDVPLAGSVYQLCESGVCASLDTLAPAVVVPAHGYASVSWPAVLGGDEQRGELALFFAPSAMGLRLFAYLCWGDGPETQLQVQATLVHARWSGACAPSLECGSIQRLPSTDGASASAYRTDERIVLRSCSPSQTD